MNKPQRQDSLYDQLKDLIPLANQEGCYDAADFLRRTVEDIEFKINLEKSLDSDP